jgi:two-component system cell cycle response regulator
MFDEEMNEVLDKINILNNAYDNIRIVDPVKKKIIPVQEQVAAKPVIHCFDFWKKDEICDDCISMRAYREKKAFVKLEYLLEEIYLVTAIPIELTDRSVVLELIKNVTDNISINFNEEGLSSGLYAILSNLSGIARRDPLTGIYNRRYLNEKLPVDLINANLTNYSISVIMVDIDFFKNVNDTYGHLTGDCTLKNVAGIIQRSLKRENDWVARYGGEEFLICLPGAPLSFASEMAEILRKKLEDTTIECGDCKLNITASFGVASVTPKLGFTAEDLIGQADKKLYEAKRNGRNRVEA